MTLPHGKATTALDYLRAIRDSCLIANEKIVLVWLLSYAGPDLECYPGIDRLAEVSGLSRSTVNRALGPLREAGWISVVRPGRGASNRYQLRLPTRYAASEQAPRVPHAGEASTHPNGTDAPERQKAHPEPSDAQEVSPGDFSVGDVSVGASRRLTVTLQKAHPEPRSAQGSGHLPAQIEREPAHVESTEEGTIPLVEVAPVRSARKRPTTHCPSADEPPEAIDAWCRTHRIPPASQVPLVTKMLRWHRKEGKPRASWKDTWDDWQESEGEHALHRSPSQRRDQEGNPNPVTRDFELTPFDEARIAAAQADRAQQERADVAAARQESEPTRAFGGRS